MKVRAAVALTGIAYWNPAGWEGFVAVIKSSADVVSKEFRANQAAMRALVAELEAHRAKAAEGGPP
jgi:hypothetical protein